MESIIVEIVTPATNAKFDFKLPSTGIVRDVVHEVVRILESTEQNISFNRENPLLCDLDSEKTLDFSHTLSDAGVRDGARLMLL